MRSLKGEENVLIIPNKWYKIYERSHIWLLQAYKYDIEYEKIFCLGDCYKINNNNDIIATYCGDKTFENGIIYSSWGYLEYGCIIQKIKFIDLKRFLLKNNITI